MIAMVKGAAAYQLAIVVYPIVGVHIENKCIATNLI